MSCKECICSYMKIGYHENKPIWRCTEIPHRFFHDLKTMEYYCKIKELKGLKHVKQMPNM